VYEAFPESPRNKSPPLGPTRFFTIFPFGLLSLPSSLFFTTEVSEKDLIRQALGLFLFFLPPLSFLCEDESAVFHAFLVGRFLVLKSLLLEYGRCTIQLLLCQQLFPFSSGISSNSLLPPPVEKK